MKKQTTKQELENWVESVGRELGLKLLVEYQGSENIGVLVEGQGLQYLGHYESAREVKTALRTSLNILHYLRKTK